MSRDLSKEATLHRDLNDKESVMQRTWVKNIPGRGDSSCKSTKATGKPTVRKKHRKSVRLKPECVGGR